MKLLGVERVMDRVHKHWLHTDGAGHSQVTVETTQDVSPIIKTVKSIAQGQSPKSQFRFKAQIPGTMIEDTAKISAKLCGITTRDAFSELIRGKTDRAKRTMKILSEGRDYRKLQAKHYA
jgi:hypothetical protein